MDQRREIRALVTGAAGGMGRATCLELLRVAAAGSRPGGSLDEFVAEMQAAGVHASAHAADLAELAAFVRLGAEVIAACGGLDVARALVHLAGPDFGYATGIDLKLEGGRRDRVLGAVPGLPANKQPSSTEEPKA